MALVIVMPMSFGNVGSTLAQILAGLRLAPCIVAGLTVTAGAWGQRADPGPGFHVHGIFR